VKAMPDDTLQQPQQDEENPQKNADETNENKTRDKREEEPYKVGDRKPPKEHQFTSENQPDGKNKSAGILRHLRGKQLMETILRMPYKGKANGEMLRAMAEYFDVKQADITTEVMMVFRQIEKSIAKRDTPAFKEVYDRVHGKVLQKFEATGEGGASLIPPSILTDEQFRALLEKMNNTNENKKDEG
jgi:hypothetical protein